METLKYGLFRFYPPFITCIYLLRLPISITNILNNIAVSLILYAVSQAFLTTSQNLHED